MMISKSSRLPVFLFILSLLVACKGKSSDAGDGGASSSLRIAVIPKGTTHEFWKAVHAGAAKAASEQAGVEIIWKGPLKEDDLKAQIDVVQTFTAQGVSGIVVAPLSDRALVTPVKAATHATPPIPVVVFDSDLQSDDYTSFVATDNYAAGKMAADATAKILGDAGGNVCVLRYQEGSASTANREKGFIDGIAAYPSVHVVSENQYGGATAQTAFATSENLLAAQKAATGGVNAVFTPNESTTFGMLLALRKANLTHKVHLVGFDGSADLVKGLTADEVDALVLQDPFNIGYLAVKTMVRSLRKEMVEKRIDTGAKLLTHANMDTPEMNALLNPDLKTWLKE
jgi:ribose transport system substrate-binding protein